MLRRLIWVLMALNFIVPSLCFADQVFFYYTDPAGTPLAMTDANGVVVWKGDYKPFGEENSTTGTVSNSKRFVGKEKDEETGLSYFGARYEDAKTGRFTAPDPIRAVDSKTSKTNEMFLHNPQRLNIYAYALNNPYRYIDPDGRETLGQRIVNSEAFIRLGEAIGASRMNAALTGYDFRGNEYSGTDRFLQFGIALIMAPVSYEKEVIEQINPRSLIPTQTRSDLTGSQVQRLTKDMKVNGYDQSSPVDVTRNASGRFEIENGHHRTQAAINAGISKIPIRILK